MVFLGCSFPGRSVSFGCIFLICSWIRLFFFSLCTWIQRSEILFVSTSNFFFLSFMFHDPNFFWLDTITCIKSDLNILYVLVFETWYFSDYCTFFDPCCVQIRKSGDYYCVNKWNVDMISPEISCWYVDAQISFFCFAFLLGFLFMVSDLFRFVQLNNAFFSFFFGSGFAQPANANFVSCCVQRIGCMQHLLRN